jgi:hypothetical protein
VHSRVRNPGPRAGWRTINLDTKALSAGLSIEHIQAFFDAWFETFPNGPLPSQCLELIAAVLNQINAEYTMKNRELVVTSPKPLFWSFTYK